MVKSTYAIVLYLLTFHQDSGNFFNGYVNEIEYLDDGFDFSKSSRKSNISGKEYWSRRQIFICENFLFPTKTSTTLQLKRLI